MLIENLKKLESFSYPAIAYLLFNLIKEGSLENLEKENTLFNLDEEILKLTIQELLDKKLIKEENDCFVSANANDNLKLKAIMVLEHLNQITNKKFKATDSSFQLIIPRLKEGYTVEDFKLVNSYYSQQWNNPTMQKYIRPKSLYVASKFNEKVEEAKKMTQVSINYETQLQDFFNRYNALSLEILNKERIKEDPIKEKDFILYWLEQGHSVDNLILVAEDLIKNWGFNPTYSQYMRISTIFSEKFPGRLYSLQTKIAVQTPDHVEKEKLTDYLNSKF